MATIANTRRKFLDMNPFRRRGVFAPAKLVATSAIKLVVAPGLRESVREVREIVTALKPDILQAPKYIRKQAQAQIDRIDETIAPISSVAERIGREVQDSTDIRAGYLVEAQVFIDKLKELKAKLLEVKARGYKQRFFYQGRIVQDLDEYDGLFWEASRGFSVSGISQANQVVSRSFNFEHINMPPALAAVVVQSSSNMKFPGVIRLRDNIKFHRLFFF